MVIGEKTKSRIAPYCPTEDDIIPSMTIEKTIGRLRALKASVLADGKVDWNETEQLLQAIRPLAAKRGFLFEDYERLLVKCREDGKITAEESRLLALQLDFLCSLFANLRLKFWLTVAIGLLLVAGSLVLMLGVISSTDASALREPPSAPKYQLNMP